MTYRAFGLVLPLAAALCIVSASDGALAQCSCVKSTLEAVKETGVVKVGVRKDTPQIGFVDEKGELVGFDIDIARAVAEKLGVKPEFHVVTAATRVTMLQQGRVDMLAANLTRYRSRDDALDFTIGYFFAPQTVMVTKASGIKTLADLAGKRVGTAIGAAARDNLARVQSQAKIQTFEGYPEAFVAFRQGLLDGIVSDAITLASLRGNSPNPADYTFIEDRFAGGENSVGVRENDSRWRDAIEHALMAMWEDGTWDKIFEKWFGPATKVPLAKADLGWKMTVYSK